MWVLESELRPWWSLVAGLLMHWAISLASHFHIFIENIRSLHFFNIFLTKLYYYSIYLTFLFNGYESNITQFVNCGQHLFWFLGITSSTSRFLGNSSPTELNLQGNINSLVNIFCWHIFLKYLGDQRGRADLRGVGGVGGLNLIKICCMKVQKNCLHIALLKWNHFKLWLWEF